MYLLKEFLLPIAIFTLVMSISFSTLTKDRLNTYQVPTDIIELHNLIINREVEK